MIEIRESGELLAGLNVAITQDYYAVIERHMRLALQPKPRLLPTWLWHRVISRVLVRVETHIPPKGCPPAPSTHHAAGSPPGDGYD